MSDHAQEGGRNRAQSKRKLTRKRSLSSGQQSSENEDESSSGDDFKGQKKSLGKRKSKKGERRAKSTVNGGRNRNNHTVIQEMSGEDEEEIVRGNHHKEDRAEGRRNTISKVKYDNEYDRVCASLQLNAVPEVLPCRDKERNYITDYLINGLQNQGSSSSLYISGMPGTGKTATTLEVIRNLQRQNKYKFEFIHINAMSLTNPNLVYTIVNEKITSRRQNPTASATFLDEFFKKKDKTKILRQKICGKGANSLKDRKLNEKVRVQAEMLRVLLIDELDALVTKKQTLLYNLFDWPCHSHSRLLVIAIANTMDLPEKMQSKIASRIGNNRLVYEPYNREQITEIIRSRIKGTHDGTSTSGGIFDDKAIHLVASKVSSYSGDIRRSLQVAKRALEITRDEYTTKYGNDYSKKLISVTFMQVVRAFEELYNTKQCILLKSLRRFEILVIMAIYLEFITSKSEKVLLDRVQDRCDNMLSQLNWFTSTSGQVTLASKRAVMPSNTFREIVKRLQSFGILNISVESGKITDNVHAQLFVYHDEITAAFEEHEIYKHFS